MPDIRIKLHNFISDLFLDYFRIFKFNRKVRNMEFLAKNFSLSPVGKLKMLIQLHL